MTRSKPKQRFRPQQGVIVKLSDGFYIRFMRDGEGGSRTKVTERLCDLNTSAAKVKLLAASHMSAVNNDRHTSLKSTAPAPVLTVGAFWVATYLPWVKQNKRPSTAKVYESNWQMYVKPELETAPLNTYTTVDACELLDYLVTKKDINKNTLAHVKSLCSGIFSKACRTKGVGITINPWREAKESVRVRPAKKRAKYTPEETVAILNALDRPQAKLFFVMCAMMGMRPSEVAAAKWEHVNWVNNKYRVCEAAPYGVMGLTKTEHSKRDVPIIDSVLSPLTAWHEANDKPSAGLLFTNNKGEAVNHNAWVKYNIDPSAKKACARWCGLYAGRHGAATTLLNLTGDIRATYQVLGNTFAVASAHYVEPDVSAGEAGMRKYEEALKAASEKHLKK